MKVRLKTVPSKQWQVGREMNRRIKKRFDAKGIEIPFPQRSLYFDEANKPVKLQFDDRTREERNQPVGEVLAEAKSDTKIFS